MPAAHVQTVLAVVINRPAAQVSRKCAGTCYSEVHQKTRCIDRCADGQFVEKQVELRTDGVARAAGTERCAEIHSMLLHV